MQSNVAVPWPLSVALAVYTQWLNEHCFANDGQRPYTPEHFTVHDQARDLYGAWGQRAFYQMDWHHVYAWVLTDGDEGGDHGLTAYFSRGGIDLHGQSYSPTLSHLVQSFDTFLTVVCHDGKLVNLPGAVAP